MKNKFKLNSSTLLVFILTTGVFGIINTEMGVIGILPLIAENFQVTVPEAGLDGQHICTGSSNIRSHHPLTVLGINRKKVMILALGLFTLSNIISMMTTNFTALLISRALPAFLHPVYVSMAFTVAAASVSKEKAPKGGSKSIHRRISWYGAGGAGDKLHCKRSFIFNGHVILHRCKCIGTGCNHPVCTFHAGQRETVLRYTNSVY